MDTGSWLALFGVISYVISTFLWVIFFLSFRMTSIVLILLSEIIGLLPFISGCLIKAYKVQNKEEVEVQYHIISLSLIILGLYNFLIILLVDSPVGPPIFGLNNMDVDHYSVTYITLLFGSMLLLILSGVELWRSGSRIWLGIGIMMSIISIGVFQFWVNELVFVFEKIMNGIPGPI